MCDNKFWVPQSVLLRYRRNSARSHTYVCFRRRNFGSALSNEKIHELSRYAPWNKFQGKVGRGVLTPPYENFAVVS